MKENAGRQCVEKEKSKEEVKLDVDLLEFAFDGELEEVKKLLEQNADPMAKAWPFFFQR